MDELNQTLSYIKKKTEKKASVGIILGTGLGSLTRHVKNPVTVPYKKIPHFVSSTVPGHKGSLILGKLFAHDVVIMSGRFHLYEGYSMQEITYPLWVMKKLGVKRLIVTNAAGSLNESFSIGDLMIITDHINLMDVSSLYNISLMKKEEAFIDTSSVYDRQLIQLAHKSAFSLGVRMHDGVYAAVKGTCFETPAEAKMLRMFGADAVGMSTVPEVLIGKHLGMKILGISCITNPSGEKFSHQGTLKAIKTSSDKLTILLKEIFKKI